MLQLFKLRTFLEEILEPEQTLLCAIPSSWLCRFMPLKGLAFLISTVAQGYKGKHLNFGHILACHSPDFEPMALPGTNPWVKVSLWVADAEDNVLAQVRDMHNSLAMRWSKPDPIPWLSWWQTWNGPRDELELSLSVWGEGRDLL